MATTIGTEAVDLPIWDIKQDMFTLPLTRHLRRGWDRAPVAAHAPRLHGRKVWKKVSTRGKTTDDMSDEVQEELQKEGAGARKKSRTMSARENIGNAIWKDKSPDNSANGIRKSVPHGREGNVSMVPINDGLEYGIQSLQVSSLPAGSMPELHFVPRKRTNNNHVITPKNKMRQTTLDGQIQPLAERVNGSSTPTKRPRKSIRKSLLAGIFENDTEQKQIQLNLRGSSNFDPLLYDEHADSKNPILKSNVIEGSGTRRRSRRTTAATRHSILHAELPIGPRDTEPHRAEQTPTDVFTVPAPEPLIVATSVDTTTLSSLEVACLKVSFTEPDLETAKVILPNTELSDDNEQSQPDTMDAQKVPTISEIIDPTQSVRPPFPTDNHGISEPIQTIPNEIFPPQQIPTSGQTVGISEQRDTPLDVDHLNEELVGQPLPNGNCGASIEKQASSILDEGAPVQNVDVSSHMLSEGCDSHASNAAYLESNGDFTMQASETVTHNGNEEKVEQGHHSDPDANSSNGTPLSSSATSNYDHDDTDMLRNFLTRVKANKAARKSPRRKRSLPHSPLRLPLGTLDNNLSPSPLRQNGENETTEPSPVKGKRKGGTLGQEGADLESRSIRRSGRTRLPVKEPPAVPSFIPVRRLGQDLDTTITLKRSEEKELAALTKVNTRKNKGNALSATEVLTRKAEEKEDPVMRQRLLKEVFEEKMEKSKQTKDKRGREKKVVTWAEEIAQFQNLTKGKVEAAQDDQEKEKSSAAQGGEEKKSGAVRVGVRSKGALGGTLNGTPAPKRKMRGVVT